MNPGGESGATDRTTTRKGADRHMRPPLDLTSPPTVTPVRAAQGEGNVAALTFDDGPNGETTAALLDYLDENDLPAVFCVIGQNIQAPGGAELLRRMVASGHVLCNHTTSYADMGAWSSADIRADLIENLRIIREALGDPDAPVPFFRAPNGNWGATPAVAVALGMQPLAVVNTISDWSESDPATLTENLRAAMKPGELVLIHDGGGDRSASVHATRTVVGERLAAGWRFTLPVGVSAARADAGNPTPHPGPLPGAAAQISYGGRVAGADGTVEGVRRANLSRVLRLVHAEGPLSRATLTDVTGLNRSTIGALVGDLAAAGLVTEGAPHLERRVGRPSPTVAAAENVVAIAVNPEVDALTIAAIGLDRRVLLRERVEVDELLSASAVAEMLATRVAMWQRRELAGHRIIGIGVAVPGLVRTADGLVRRAPHLDWTDVPVRDLIADATGLPTAIDNDATLGALAESLYGAARGIPDVIYLNGGASGIGGGLVIDGHLVRGAGGYAGEFGQNRPGIARPADRRSGPQGTLEDEVSRARLLAALGLLTADEPTLEEAIRSSSHPDVTAEVDRQRRILSTALANAVNVLNPAVVVLGGFLATLLECDPLGTAEAVAAQAMAVNAEQVILRPAALGQDRLLVGAAEIALEALLADPLSVSAAPSSLAGPAA